VYPNKNYTLAENFLIGLFSVGQISNQYPAGIGYLLPKRKIKYSKEKL
jgi:hypothetical protein